MTLVMLVISFIYILFVSIIYFRQKHIDTIELTIFSQLLCSNIIGLIIEIIAKLSTMFLSTQSIITHIICRVYLLYLIWFSLLMASYVYSVAVNVRSQEDNRNKVVVIMGCVFAFVSSILVCILPVKFDSLYSDYCFGPAVNFLYGYSVIMIIFCLFEMITHLKNVVLKKYLPLIVFVIGMAVGAIIQKIFPQITITTVVETFVLFTMYFTIENPDIKMIKQLEVAREQADKANMAKTDFLSSMSHEIRTPLNAIVGFSDCIMDSKSLDEAQENAKDIVNASQTLLEIVNGILDISKIEAGKLEITNSKYNAPETFEELAKLITPKMTEKGLDFTYKIAPDIPKTLFGDHANIKKVVTNLLSNAAKYTEHGFVHYEVNCINTNDVSKLIISVEDSGRGIKKDSVDKMFTKFQRLDEDRNTTIEGTGLGLAITKQLIELMGGRIIVHTVYGEGSKFTVVLNQRIEKEDIVQKKKAQTTLDLHDVRILLVDDTPLNLKVACKLLERYGANQLDTCDSGFQCLDKIESGQVYDIILLDDMMPRMSGVETLKKLKEIPGFDIPTIALTANAITGMREKYLADGFNDFLAKPIDKEQLVLVLNQVLGRSITETLDIPSEKIQKEVSTSEEQEDNLEEQKKKVIIPVEDNIEEILGDAVERNYKEEVEVLDHNPPISLIPVVDIDVTTETLEKVYDRKYLEDNGCSIDQALELLGDMDMYNMTISDFVKDVEDKWSRIVSYKESNNMPDYAIEVHSLKSDCKYLGFMKLADIAYQHEIKSKENDSSYVVNHFHELEEEYKKVLVVARTYVEHNPVSE